MKQAMFTENSKCLLCPHNCVIPDGKRGICGVRVNKNGRICTLVYGMPCSIAVDPVEKKPLYHFHPGQKIFSFGTVGCNFRCLGCQNWEIATTRPGEEKYKIVYSPERVVELAEEEGCTMIAYTYTEPAIFYEYVYDTAREAKKIGLKNVIVSNGYINEAPLRELCRFIDAANIDLKFFDDKKYMKYSGGRLQPVLNTLKVLKEEGVWTEITNLMIPGWSDDMKMFEDMCIWIKDHIGSGTPLHISRFFPCYKLEDASSTPLKTLHEAENIAKKHLRYVYVGNVFEESSTTCQNCNKLLIRRQAYMVEDFTARGVCPKCKEKLPGVF